MVNLYGKDYYIDFEKLSESCQVTPKEGGVVEINIFKYELMKLCIQRIFEDGFEEDDKESFTLKEKSLPFRLAFYTLIKNNIIIEDNDDDEE